MKRERKQMKALSFEDDDVQVLDEDYELECDEATLDGLGRDDAGRPWQD